MNMNWCCCSIFHLSPVSIPFRGGALYLRGSILLSLSFFTSAKVLKCTQKSFAIMNDGPPIDNHNANGNGNNSLQPQQDRSNGMEISSHDPPRDDHQNGNDNSLIGSAHLRPVFMGNLDYGCTVEDLEDLFLRPIRGMDPVPVDRVDLKRGYAFVFFREARNQIDKDRLERYVDDINGMYVNLCL